LNINYVTCNDKQKLDKKLASHDETNAKIVITYIKSSEHKRHSLYRRMESRMEPVYELSEMLVLKGVMEELQGYRQCIRIVSCN
jgi:uncharacterized protein YutE (UPF0331/DUF86 family)